MRRPSGDQTGDSSLLGFDVSRVKTPRSTSPSHTSEPTVHPICVATRLPSGESVVAR